MELERGFFAIEEEGRRAGKAFRGGIEDFTSLLTGFGKNLLGSIRVLLPGSTKKKKNLSDLL